MRLILALLFAAALPLSAYAYDGEQSGPLKAKVGDQAELDLPAGYTWIDQAHVADFLKGMGNIPSGNERGAVIGETGSEKWFGLFEFEDVGYIKDAASEKLDADDLLKSIKEGNEAANEERKKQGYGSLEVVGWGKPPFYNPATQRLEWSIVGRDNSGEVINYKTRVLGRKGVMSVVLVCDAKAIDKILPDFQQRLEGFNFSAGEKYAEWKEGDKVAAIGLAALILGGVAAKTGLLAYLLKYFVYGLKYLGKLIIVIFAAIGAAIKKAYEWLTGSGKKKKPEGYVPQSSSAHAPVSPSASAASANAPPARLSEAQPQMDDPKA